MLCMISALFALFLGSAAGAMATRGFGSSCESIARIGYFRLS
jgi:hypothetical protein